MKEKVTSTHITVRRYDLVDIPLLFEAARESVLALSPWLPWCHADYSMEESLEWIVRCRQLWDQGQEYHYGVFDAKTDAFLGGVGLNQLDRLQRRANLGYWVRTSRSRCGVATAAARLAARTAFADLDLDAISILVAVNNRYSQRVAEKLGARRQRVLPNQLVVRGQPQDAVLFSLTAEDLESACS